MWTILLAEFWGDLRSQKTRTLLTTLAIACGTFIVVVLLALGEGLKRNVLTELLGQYDNAVVLYPGMTSLPFRGLSQRPIRFTEDDVAALLRHIPDVEAASPVYSRWDVRITAEGNRVPEETTVEGVYPVYGSLKRLVPHDGGRFISDRDQLERRRVIFLGDSLAARLFPAGDAVGNVVRVNGQPFVVIGVARRKTQTGMDFTGDETMARIPATTFVSVFQARHPGELVVRPRDPQAGEALETALRAVLAQRHRFDPADRRAVYVQNSADEARTARRVLTGLQAFLGLIGGLTLMVAGVGVANIMYVAVKERTLEVGIKLAIGARRPHIMAQYIFEAVLLSLAGGLAGMLAAAAAVAGISGIPKEHEALRYMLDPQLSWPIAVATVGVLTAIGLLAGVFPARRAAMLDPVESLRYE